MQRRNFNRTLGAAALAPMLLGKSRKARAAGEWSLAADVAECCSCEIPCPCNFGRPTTLRCDGNRLIEIREGQVDDLDLAGVRFLVAFEMGQWTRIYVDDALTDSQSAAFDAILPLAFAGFQRGARSIERVPLSVDRSADLIRFAVPDSEVEMKPLRGLNGELIRINGLPSNAFFGYVQYESVRHVHRGADRQWSHSGTNGFTSQMIASS
ncbi:MAG: DUF1326 domain-containing protein [Gammaproteobacteria bacterium]|jgi:hypothetical protein